MEEVIANYENELARLRAEVAEDALIKKRLAAQIDNLNLQNRALKEEYDASVNDLGHARLKLQESNRLIEEIRKDFAIHSCPSQNGFCWRCNALEVVEKVLSKTEKRKGATT